MSRASDIQPLAIFWFRRDLRIEDNRGLEAALNSGLAVLPIFIFDPRILKPLPKTDARMTFICQALDSLREQLRTHGSDLEIYHGEPVKIWSVILKKHKIKRVFFNEDYEPYARKRDDNVRKLVEASGGELVSFKDQVIFGPEEVLKSDGKPYRVYTPYSKAWRNQLKGSDLQRVSSGKRLSSLLRFKAGSWPSIEDLGFETSKTEMPKANLSAALLGSYARTRDFPALANGTSRLGLHLRFGTVSIRKIARAAEKYSTAFLGELIWREFFMQILFHFPQSAEACFDERYENIDCINNRKQFEAWCEGRTGYPIVDAGMRELNRTGFMHNRARMIAASFLTKHLLVHWRWGERYFAKRLLDYELSSNVGNWQWAAGCGCDAAPYFRVFNPKLQAEKFDPQSEYIRRWVPELETPDYPEPIVDHDMARKRAIGAYRKALARSV